MKNKLQDRFKYQFGIYPNLKCKVICGGVKHLD